MKLSIKFHLDNPNANTSSIFMFYSYNKIRNKIQTGLSVAPNDWDKKTNRAKIKTNNYMVINTRLSEIIAFVEDIVYYLSKEDSFDNNKFKSLVREKFENKQNTLLPSKQITFYQYYDEFIRFKESNNLVTKNVILLYKRSKNYLKNYAPNLTFDNIDNNFLTEYHTYLINKYKFQYNGVKPLFTNSLFVFLNWALSEEITLNQKYKKFNIKSTEVKHKTYLTIDEIKQIHNTQNLPNYLENAKTWLMIMCFTGLRVSDALKLNKSKINFETNLIEIITQKTQLKVTIPITHIVKPYLEKLVNGQAHSISAQKLNNYYKELGKVCKIDSELSIVTFSPKRKETILKKYELISNHCFRRTFATISLELGLQPSIIMKITGHKTLSSFEEYIGFTTKNAVDKINDVWNNLKM
ncbi:MAG: tyrosine-type recombinase/integrase [Candidatus Kapaibacteriota bacterium]